jgi:3-oxoacyl-[acyl-carrier-protein] synthase II
MHEDTAMKRVVITGIGLVTPLGNSPKTFFQNALDGVSGVNRIRKFDASSFPVQIGGEVDFDPQQLGLPADRLSEMPVVAQWAVLAARKAVEDSGLDVEAEDSRLIDVIVGVSISSIERLRPEFLAGGGAGMVGAPAASAVFMNPAAAAVQISRDLGLNGETTNITTACSSSTTAIGYATRLIQHGESTCVLTGGADEGVCPLFFGAFARTLSSRNDDPEHASRPFDRGRDGLVLSDAACILVLEEYERAQARGATVYAEVSGFGSTRDDTSMFKLGKSEKTGAQAINMALGRAQRTAADVDYYCAHGTSDPFLDVRETRMVKQVFGRKVVVSSIKSMMGHPMGAAGAVQTANCAMAIRNRLVPPTINYDDPDPECDLDYVPNQAREMPVRNAIVYTLGNGGANAALVLSAC